MAIKSPYISSRGLDIQVNGDPGFESILISELSGIPGGVPIPPFGTHTHSFHQSTPAEATFSRAFSRTPVQGPPRTLAPVSAVSGQPLPNIAPNLPSSTTPKNTESRNTGSPVTSNVKIPMTIVTATSIVPEPSMPSTQPGSATAAPGASGGFSHNTPALAGVSAALGLTGLCLAASLILIVVRRKRSRRDRAKIMILDRPTAATTAPYNGEAGINEYSQNLEYEIITNPHTARRPPTYASRDMNRDDRVSVSGSGYAHSQGARSTRALDEPGSNHLSFSSGAGGVLGDGFYGNVDPINRGRESPKYSYWQEEPHTTRLYRSGRRVEGLSQGMLSSTTHRSRRRSEGALTSDSRTTRAQSLDSSLPDYSSLSYVILPDYHESPRAQSR